MEKLYLPNNKELTMESQEKHNIEWKSGNSGMDRGFAVDAGRFKMETLYPF